MSFPDELLPKPLPHIEVYILLALARNESTRYKLKSRLFSMSFGALRPADNIIYRAVGKLHDEGLVDLARTEPGRADNLPVKYYSISEHGRIRLQEEIIRLDQVMKIARHAGVMDDETPADIQRLRLDFLDGGKG